ncbi:MAG: AraC family transcriptional regulator [Planctomycetota bacterium]
MMTRDRLMRLCKARDLLRSRSHKQLSIDEVAQSAAMSRYHFVRQFTAVFGETPVRFRTRARLEWAKELLSDGTQTVTDVCMTVGFSSLGSFSSLFARRFGVSPSAYREQRLAATESRTPGCLEIQRAAWTREAQISRSARVRATDNHESQGTQGRRL